MLVHHSSESYDLAAKRAADHARNTLDALIDRGRSRGLAVIEAVEAGQPRDLLVPAPALAFAPDPGAPRRILVRGGSDANAKPLFLHPFALGQAADKAGLPRSYLNRLMAPENEPWGPALLARNLNALFREGHADGEPDDAEGSYLLRTLRSPQSGAEEVRGFLSSRFKRLDSRPIVAAFADACGRVGAVPIEGYALDTKIALKAVLPRVAEPVPNEVMAYGMLLENSDYGNGALQVSFFMLRLWCTNYAISETALRRVHLGARLASEVAWSAKTLAAESDATASAVHDLVTHHLNERHVGLLNAGIRRANAEKVDPTQVSVFLKRHVARAEADAIVAAFNSADVEKMPPGQTRWRMSNAISWIAGRTENEERRLDLMKLAGSVVTVPEAA